MKSSERKVALLAISEHIEMELLSSEEPCMVIITQQDEEHSFHQKSNLQRHLAHPLVPDCEEEPAPEVQTQTRRQSEPKTESPASQETALYTHVLRFMENIEMEMQVFPPFKVCQSELVELKSDDPSVMSPVSDPIKFKKQLIRFILVKVSGSAEQEPIVFVTPSQNKTSRLKWKRLAPQKTGLVVKDVICLPRGQYVAQLDRHVIPQGKEREALSAVGMTARITVDYGWSANQMASRLVMLFGGRFLKRAGQRFSFTYLQCVQGSMVLFIPDTPAEDWTGEQVLRMSGHGPIYIFSHQDDLQTESDNLAKETPAVNRKEFFLEASTESCQDEDTEIEKRTQTRVCRNKEVQLTLDLDTILRLFRQESVNRDVETHIQVRRRDLLHSALKVVRRPGFCFKKTPVISFSGEETIGHEGPLREFFRLSLLELQQSSIFEGHPGRLFLTYDLAALEDRKYYEAGVLIGWSLAHGGPGPQCLHPVLYQLMCGFSPSLEDFIWTDIVDAEVQIRLQQLQSCTDVKLLSPNLCDWVSSCGITGISSARSDQIPAVYIYLVKHYIYHRVASMISQFTEGLNSCGGLWDTVQSHWEAFVPVMTSEQQQPLTKEEFKQLFTVCYSHSDDQLRAAEEATVVHWETILKMISDGQADFSFEDLLIFITGADRVPHLGFSKLISLHFYSQDPTMSSVRLPHASTCALELFLPRAVLRAVDLLVLLSRAVHEALGFTCFPAE